MKKRLLSFFMVSLCVLSHPLTVSASSLPTPPPTLKLVEPQLKAIRGNAYQYGLEKKGFDVQGGVSPLQVLFAVESACALTDYAFQGTDEYDATIQHVQDKSGLPEHMQGLNMELYFAKIDYLDMQVGLYLDAQGNTVGDKIIQYKENVNDMLDTCIGTIKNNVLGRIIVEDLNLGNLLLQPTGGINGLPGMTGYASCKENFAANPYCVDMFQVVSCAPGTQFFVLDKNIGYPTHIAYIFPSNTPPTFRTNRGSFKTQNEAKSFISSIPVRTAWTGSPVKNGYRMGYSSLSGIWLEPNDFYNAQINYPWATLTANADEFENWAYNQYIPNLAPNSGLVPGAISLNPNTQNNPLPQEGLGYDSLADHNRAVAEVVPKIEPSLEPLPENAPLYTPSSGLESIPHPKPKPMPEYVPLPNPEPNPEPSPEPNPPSDDISPSYKVELTNIFPFCIPFDFIDLLEVLSAEPVTPRFYMPFVVKQLGIDMEVEINLSFLDGVAAMARKLETVSFVIMLLMITRKMIKW